MKKSFVAAIISLVLLNSSAFIGSQSLDEYRRQAHSLIRDGQWAEALETISAALELMPTDPFLNAAAGLLFSRMGKLDEARRYLEKARRTASSPQIEEALAAIEFRSGHYADAIEILEGIAQLPQTSASANYNLALLLLIENRDEEALQALSRWVEMRPDDAAARQLYALLLDRLGQPEAAKQELHEALKLNPHNPDLLMRLADQAFSSGHFARALEYAEMATVEDPENPQYWSKLCQIQQALATPDPACRKQARLEMAFSGLSEAVYFASQGSLDKAIEILEPLLDENAEFLTGALYLVGLYQRADNREAALELFSRFPDLKNHALSEQAWLEGLEGDFDLTADLLASISTTDQLNGLLLEGYRYLTEGRWKDALWIFEEVGEEYPLHTGLLQLQARCLLRLGHYDKALHILKKAYDLGSRDAEVEAEARQIRFLHGVQLEAQGEWDRALITFDRLHREDPAEPLYLFHRAYNLQMQGHYRTAVESYRKGLRLDPESDWALHNLSRCQYALGQFEAAAKNWADLSGRSKKPEYDYHQGLALIQLRQYQQGWHLIASAARQNYPRAMDLMRRAHRRFPE